MHSSRRIFALGLCASSLALLAQPTGAQAAPRTTPLATTSPLPLDPAVRTGRLANGLRYYVRANERPEKRAELRLIVNAGSVLEDADQRGLAHFVEHMAFNGTRRFPKQAIVDYIERVGMRFGPDLNAYTSFDETVYMLEIPTDTASIVARGLDILEDWAHAVTFDSLEVEKERGVIVEEWRSGLGAQSRVRDKQFPVLFRGSRYAERLPIGDKQTLETAPRSALVRYYRDWYRPDLMAVVAVGDFDPAVMVQLIRARFSRIPARVGRRTRTLFPVPDHDSTYTAVVTDPELQLASTTVYYKQPAREFRTVADWRQRAVEGLYSQMLNLRLFELTQKPDAPFVGAGSQQGSFVRTKEVYVLGAGVKAGGIERGLEAVLVEAKRVDRHGFTASELERAKRDYLRSLEQAYDEREKTESDAYASEYVNHFLEGEPSPGIAEEWAMAQRLVPGITVDDVNRAARGWISDRNRVILASAPANDSLVPNETALRGVFTRVDAAQIAAYADTVSDAPLLPNIPAPTAVTSEVRDTVLGTWTFTLANGMRVVVKPTDFKADEVLINGFGPGGTSTVSDADHLNAEMAGTVAMFSGAGEFSLVTLAKKLAGKSVQAYTDFNEEWDVLSAQASPKDLETAMQLLHLQITRPRLDTTATTALMQNLKAQLANRGANPDAVFQDTLNAVMSQYHPRRRPPTAARVDSIDVERAFALYRERFADVGDFTVVVVGAVNPDTVRELARRYLGTLPASGRRDMWRDVGVRPPEGVVERVVRKGTEPKADTRIIFHGSVEDSRANRYALSALADVLEIKLRERLREALAGTYGASVSAGLDRIPVAAYQVGISFGSSPDRVDELTRAVFAEIDSLKARGPTETDLAKVKETMTRERETNIKTNSWWLSQLSARLRNAEDPREIATSAQFIASLTPQIVRDAARRWLNEKQYVKVVLLPEKS
jgi:zinc protease